MKLKRISKRFTLFAEGAASFVGSLIAFALACLILLLWFVVGPHYSFSDQWEAHLNSLLAIVTFLIVFILQSGQNRSSLATHLKLDEIIRALDSARNEIIQAENKSEEELAKLKEEILDE